MNEDGTVSRAVQQPADSAIGEGWDEVRPTATADPDAWGDPIEGTPRAEDGGGTAAWGEFLSARALPGHVRIDAERETPAVLDRDSEMIDHGIFKEYRWRETLTAGTSLLEMEAARREAIELAAWWTGAVLEEGMPAGTDPSPLVDWLRAAGGHWAADVNAVLLDAAAGTPADEPTSARMAAISGRYGLDLMDEGGDVVPAEEVFARTADFGRELIRTHVLTPDGKPLDDDALGRALWLLLETPRNPEENPGEVPPPDVAEIRGRVLREKFGSDEAMKKTLERIANRLLGAHFQLLFATPREFVYRHTMPGLILETSGTLVSDSSVLFRFKGKEAFPFHRHMTARSLRIDAAAQQNILGGVHVANREQVVRFLEYLETPSLRTAWERCVAEGSLAPLRGRGHGEAGAFLRLLEGEPLSP